MGFLAFVRSSGHRMYKLAIAQWPVTLLLLTGALEISACNVAPEQPYVSSVPCGGTPAIEVSLGDPMGGITSDMQPPPIPGFFTTSGSQLYATARNFDHSEVLDFNKKNLTGLR